VGLIPSYYYGGIWWWQCSRNERTSLKVFSEGQCNETKHGKTTIPHLCSRRHYCLWFALCGDSFEHRYQRSKRQHNSASNKQRNSSGGQLREEVFPARYLNPNSWDESEHGESPIYGLWGWPTEGKQVLKLWAHLRRVRRSGLLWLLPPCHAFHSKAPGSRWHPLREWYSIHRPCQWKAPGSRCHLLREWYSIHRHYWYIHSRHGSIVMNSNCNMEATRQ